MSRCAALDDILSCREKRRDAAAAAGAEAAPGKRPLPRRFVTSFLPKRLRAIRRSSRQARSLSKPVLLLRHLSSLLPPRSYIRLSVACRQFQSELSVSEADCQRAACTAHFLPRRLAATRRPSEQAPFFCHSTFLLKHLSSWLLPRSYIRFGMTCKRYGQELPVSELCRARAPGEPGVPTLAGLRDLVGSLGGGGDYTRVFAFLREHTQVTYRAKDLHQLEMFARNGLHDLIALLRHRASDARNARWPYLLRKSQRARPAPTPLPQRVPESVQGLDHMRRWLSSTSTRLRRSGMRGELVSQHLEGLYVDWLRSSHLHRP